MAPSVRSESPTFQSFVQIVDGKGDMRNDSDDLGHVAMRLEPDPLDPVGTCLKTSDVWQAGILSLRGGHFFCRSSAIRSRFA
jgi:hypothetical protein